MRAHPRSLQSVVHSLDPTTPDMKLDDLFAQRIPKQFCVLDVIQDIVGASNLASDGVPCLATAYQVRQSDEAGFSAPSVTHEEWMKELGLDPVSVPGTLYIPPLESRDARHVAMAAHEAVHAWLCLNCKGDLWRDEKMTNQLAELWLRKHLSGIRLHVALEMIVQSRISYAIN